MSNHPPVRYLDRTTPPHVSTLIFLAGISALAMNVYLPSLPAMADYFETDYQLIQLSVSLYLGFNAALQLLVGPLSDRFGRRPVMLWSFALFLLATIGCIYSTSIEAFLFFRMSQAVIVAGIVLSRAVVHDIVPRAEAASMIGYVTMGMAIVPMIGPAIGGQLEQAFGWQASFWMLFILGAALAWLAWRDLGETNTHKSSSFMEQAKDYPELLTSRRFWGYCLTASFAAGSFFSYLGGAPYVGSEGFGMDAGTLGLFFGAPAVGYMVGNGISGRFSTRFGINRMVLYGAILTTAGLLAMLLLFILGLGSQWVFFGFVTFVGLGNGMVLPNATAGMMSVRAHLAGSASGLGGAIMIAGGAILSSLAGVVLTPGSGALPLIWLMVSTSILGIISIVYVMRREKTVQGQ